VGSNNSKNWEDGRGDEYYIFRSKVRKIIVNLHGDYDSTRGSRANDYALGRSLLIFKRWMSRMYYQRFAKEETEDFEIGIKGFKGRYRYLSPVSGAMFGAGAGLVVGGSFGIPVTCFGMLAGYIWGLKFGQKSNVNFIRESIFVTETLFRNLIRFPINSVAGKEIVKASKFMEGSGFDARTSKAYKANMVDLSIMLACYGFALFVKALFEDDKEKYKLKNFLANRAMQLSHQSSMYVNPEEFHGGVPVVIRFFKDVKDFIGEPNTKKAKKVFTPTVLKGSLGFKAQTQWEHYNMYIFYQKAKEKEKEEEENNFDDWLRL